MPWILTAGLGMATAIVIFAPLSVVKCSERRREEQMARLLMAAVHSQII
jgi:hypothetical protein